MGETHGRFEKPPGWPTGQQPLMPWKQEERAHRLGPLTAVDVWKAHGDGLVGPGLPFNMGLQMILDGVAHRIAIHDAESAS